MNNIILEFTKKNESVNDKVIDDLEKHVDNNWYRLVAFTRKDGAVRIQSTRTDIMDVINDKEFCHGFGSYWLKIKEIEY
tara:strand:+ start:1577 stop:1813 length:237 start_codon:yes stop_codon:yes gene_type:complete